MALWDEVKSNLVEWYTITSDKTTEAAKIGSRRWDKFGISRDIERQFSELGSLVYSGLKNDEENILNQEPLLELVTRIETLETELAAKSEEIENIKTEYAKASAAGGADQEVEQPVTESEPVTETVLKDPVLEVGNDDSAILMEPVEGNVDNSNDSNNDHEKEA
ncbi:MAG: hypothetical protein GY780_13680 [bacterium]|nr:hypothetical protein [bacterium]